MASVRVRVPPGVHRREALPSPEEPRFAPKGIRRNVVQSLLMSGNTTANEDVDTTQGFARRITDKAGAALAPLTHTPHTKGPFT